MIGFVSHPYFCGLVAPSQLLFPGENMRQTLDPCTAELGHSFLLRPTTTAVATLGSPLALKHRSARLALFLLFTSRNSSSKTPPTKSSSLVVSQLPVLRLSSFSFRIRTTFFFYFTPLHLTLHLTTLSPQSLQYQSHLPPSYLD
jgi:hypothetical protein